MEENKKSSHRVLWGVLCLIGPFLLLIMTLSAYAITTFAFAQTGSDMITTARVIRLILSLLGIVSVVGLFVGLPVGIVLLVKNNK